MSAKYLLREYFSLCPDNICDINLLTESEKKMRAEGALLLSGKFQVADQKNFNGRIYPRATLAREVDLYQKLINESRALGELDHPTESVVSLDRSSHIVKRLWWDGDFLMGVIKVLSTPKGEILKAFIKDGVQVGISSRSLGNVRETREGLIVEQDLQLISFDCVADPSTPNAFLQLREARDPAQSGGPANKADRLNRILSDIYRGDK